MTDEFFFWWFTPMKNLDSLSFKPEGLFYRDVKIDHSENWDASNDLLCRFFKKREACIIS